VSPSITRTLTFILRITLWIFTRSKRKEKYKRKEEEQLTYTKEKNPTLKPSSFLSVLLQGGIYSTKGLSGSRQGHASKLDTWLHRTTIETRPRPDAACTTPKCAAFGSTLLPVHPVSFWFSAPRISRFGLQSLGLLL